MTSYLYRVDSGIAGEITRPDRSTVESGFINSANAPTAFGAPVKMVSGKINAIQASDTKDVFYGILTRTAPSIAGDTTSTYASGTPNTASLQGLLTRGYINVKCTVGTPVQNAPVYMRVVTDTGKAIGDIEATSDITVTGTAGTNTGNGTIGTLSATQVAQVGTYKVTFTAATVFNVYAPDGTQLKVGATGTAYTAGGVTFTITAGGTAFVSGDTFNVAVVKNNVQLDNVVWAVGGIDSNYIAEIRVKG